VHAIRILILLGIVFCIHQLHRNLRASKQSDLQLAANLADVRSLLPSADSIAAQPSAAGLWPVYDQGQQPIGFVVQTSPQADSIIGFSGPTNVLIAFHNDKSIGGLLILNSADTRDHVQQIKQDARFLNSFDGMKWGAIDAAQIDAVSGATLTSLAIVESVARRMGEELPSLRFPESISLEQARALFPAADRVEFDVNSREWKVYQDQQQLGSLVDSSPAADLEIGYQGPTRTLIGLDSTGKIIGIRVGKSFDNEPYVDYVRDEEYFLELFNNLTLAELAKLDLAEHGVEGVSGATLTSQAVARGIKLASQRQIAPPPSIVRASNYDLQWTLADGGTVVVVLIGLVFAFTDLRGNRWLRIGFQVVVIVYLGLINGALISQVMLVGWTQNGIAWRSAIGLVVLSATAFIIPVSTKKNFYCNQLCPHGAIQQLIKNRSRFRWHVPRRLNRFLNLIPGLLLAVVAAVAIFGLPLNLVDIEPFDAYLIRVSGWASITIALLGLVASFFVPMAYCRYGCPTGALLNHTRFHARADRFGPRDYFAITVLVAGCLKLLFSR
jgi:Na+-translocating ferredoxin:NAD+ oxidoreductase RnfG subunit